MIQPADVLRDKKRQRDQENAVKAAQRIGPFEMRFMVHTKDGMAIDWVAASNADPEGFRQYAADRQAVRAWRKRLL